MRPRSTREHIVAALRTAELSTSELADVLGVSRQAILHHIRVLVDSGEVMQTGSKRGPGTRYRLSAIVSEVVDLAGLEEHEVWEQIVDRLGPMSDAAKDLHRYAFTEMLNNAIDHSEGTNAIVSARQVAGMIEVTISDDGVGAFRKIADERNLDDLDQAVAELTKGKVTTDPDRHSGEGIFFTSKAVDSFSLESNGLAWTTVNTRDGFDWAVAPSSVEQGTTVTWQISNETDRDLMEVFNRYTVDHSFSRTATQIRLFAVGRKLISRSEARRLATGLHEFGEVELDFSGVDQVGQGFADELFRVWASSHPQVVLSPINMSDSVADMVARHTARAGSDDGAGTEVESLETLSSGSVEFNVADAADGSDDSESG